MTQGLYYQNPALLPNTDLEWYIRNLGILVEAAVLEEEPFKVMRYSRLKQAAAQELERRMKTLEKEQGT